MSYGEFEVI